MLAWIDLEMTGLDPATEVIVEIAVLITDDALEIVAEGPDLVVSQPAEKLAAMADVVKRMHASSGLTIEVEASTTSLEDAGEQVLAFLRQHIPEAGTVPLCGNSIGTDRRFLAAYLPEVDRFFHYRSVDVSTVKELCKRWYPDAYRAAPAKASGHRALDDIRESVKELCHYRDTIFLPRGAEPDNTEPHDPEGTTEPVSRPVVVVPPLEAQFAPRAWSPADDHTDRADRAE